MTEEEDQGTGGEDTQTKPAETPPPPKDELDAPGFTLVTKGEKGAGIERRDKFNNKDSE